MRYVPVFEEFLHGKQTFNSTVQRDFVADESGYMKHVGLVQIVASQDFFYVSDHFFVFKIPAE
mgnify:CR=1 FL=1